MFPPGLPSCRGLAPTQKYGRQIADKYVLEFKWGIQLTYLRGFYSKKASHFSSHINGVRVHKWRKQAHQETRLLVHLDSPCPRLFGELHLASGNY